jgi:hypothetical protein
MKKNFKYFVKVPANTDDVKRAYTFIEQMYFNRKTFESHFSQLHFQYFILEKQFEHNMWCITFLISNLQ